jgi:hypothetical protein
MTERATYLYCVARSPAAPPLAGAPAGLPDAGPPRVLPLGEGLWLVVADAPLPAYSGPEIERRLAEMPWVSERALAHEQVVEHFAAAGAVVPMKLFTLFDDDDRALAALAGRRADLADLLDRVAGAEEWGVRVLLHEQRARELAAGTGPPAAAVSGTGFLQRKKLQQDILRDLLGGARGTADRLYEQLAGQARAARRRPLTGAPDGARLLLDAVFLVPREDAARFEAAVDGLAEELAARGCEVVLTGPWPPYHFVTEETVEEPA